VQHRPVLRDVDLLPSDHGVDFFTQVLAFGELQEQVEGFKRGALARVIEVQSVVGGEHLGAACWVEEEFAEVYGLDVFCMVLKGFPFSSSGDKLMWFLLLLLSLLL